MGEVWRGRDTRLDRSVAVQIPPASFARDEQFRVRFEREAKAISSLSHPYICTLFDVGQEAQVRSGAGCRLRHPAAAGRPIPG
jgi:serine/threonine protein kinase